MSGSSSEVASLKSRFEEGETPARQMCLNLLINIELDVDLVASETHYDTHAVAGLLKLYFRELPSPMFPRELKAKLVLIGGTD